jgi:hypothetical protein
MAHTKEGAAQGTTNEGLKKVVEYLKSNNMWIGLWHCG